MNESNRKMILHVLDDEPDICRYISFVAGALEFDVQSTESPSAFLRNYSADIDVLVLDLYMPGIDGIELLRYMADNVPPRNIILISGGDSIVLKSAQKLAGELGLHVKGVLQKPFRRSDLEQVLLEVKNADVGITAHQLPVELPSLNELQEAIEQGDISVVFQPQVRCSDQKIQAFEALARWEHKRIGPISPLIFIAMAEKAGLIADLDWLVMKKAVAWLALFKDLDLHVKMSVNMSAYTLSDLTLPERVIQELQRSRIPAESLSIEVTETALMTDLVKSLDILTRLRMKGVVLSIDDFGTGYSSMAQLVRIPFSELKIDGTFVEGAVLDKECKAIVKASVMLAKELGMQVVAERVSSESALQLARELKCDLVQGYFTGRPMSPEQVVQLLTDRASVCAVPDR
ncbi:MAG: EAL domain-containing response regulator [Amphritea sp.]|nr:EAL domain-containing response regulator [Amphritea sp.]